MSLNTFTKVSYILSLLCYTTSLKATMRFLDVNGYSSRRNGVVYSSPTRDSHTTDLVIFFPGDVQNYAEQMSKHSSDTNLLKWHLEATTQYLSEKFPSKHILLIKPSRTDDGVFNHYDNFVPLDKSGGPDHTHGLAALPHLRRITNSAMRRVTQLREAQSSISATIDFIHDSFDRDNRNISEVEYANCNMKNEQFDSISIVGFSKGCVVLNQLVTEIYLLSELPDEERNACLAFLHKVTEMAWLDGGHQGRKDTWVTNPNFVTKLVQTLPQLSITVHVTPYQMFCKSRPWIGDECRRFVALCRNTDVQFHYKMHGEDQEQSSLDTHFLALEAYGTDAKAIRNNT